MTPVLELRSVAIGYRTTRTEVRTVARHLDLTLPAGEFVCLLGPNGAGKSTLIRTLAGMQPALAGDILLRGRPLAQRSAAELAKEMSVVLTDRIDVGHLRVFSLVALGRHPYTNWLGKLTPADEKAVWDALEETGSRPLAERAFDELSDGERQRVLIARALAQEPEVLVLDEPTAFLDLPRRVELMRLLRRLARRSNRAILCSTHDLSLALNSADCLWLLGTDGLMRAGAPEDLVLNGAFEAAFAQAGMEFDRLAGSFLVQEPHGRSICLHGSGLEETWTRRALERLGFDVTEDDSQNLPQVTFSKENRRWSLSNNGQLREFANLQELVAFVRQEWAPG